MEGVNYLFTLFISLHLSSFSSSPFTKKAAKARTKHNGTRVCECTRIPRKKQPAQQTNFFSSSCFPNILFFSFPIYKASVAGAAIHQICSVGDDVVSEELAKVYNRGQVEKGPAFPTCVSPNNIVAYNSPGAENATTAAKGDLLKM